MKHEQAVSATVTGNDQQVGFRAMVMKQAISTTSRGPGGERTRRSCAVHTLQGDGKRLDPAIAAIQEGTKKLSNIEVATTPATVDPKLDTFTIVGWTSTSRHITTPYNLVFTLRENDEAISESRRKGRLGSNLGVDPEGRRFEEVERRGVSAIPANSRGPSDKNARKRLADFLLQAQNSITCFRGDCSGRSALRGSPRNRPGWGESQHSSASRNRVCRSFLSANRRGAPFRRHDLQGQATAAIGERGDRPGVRHACAATAPLAALGAGMAGAFVSAAD